MYTYLILFYIHTHVLTFFTAAFRRVNPSSNQVESLWIWVLSWIARRFGWFFGREGVWVVGRAMGWVAFFRYVLRISDWTRTLGFG